MLVGQEHWELGHIGRICVLIFQSKARTETSKSIQCGHIAWSGKTQPYTLSAFCRRKRSVSNKRNNALRCVPTITPWDLLPQMTPAAQRKPTKASHWFTWHNVMRLHKACRKSTPHGKHLFVESWQHRKLCRNLPSQQHQIPNLKESESP